MWLSGLVCAIEPRILLQAVGATVPGSLVGTQHRAVQLLPFFGLRSLRLLWICVSNRAPSYLCIVEATAAALQGRRFTAATNDASACARMCVRSWAVLNTNWTIPPRSSSEFQKHPRSRQTVQQQQYNSSEAHIGSYT